MSLDPRTIKKIEEFFKDKVCIVCGEPAVRFTRKAFRCDKHYRSRIEERQKIKYTIREYKLPKFRKLK